MSTKTDTKLLPAFEKFVQDLRKIWAENPDDETRMKDPDYGFVINGVVRVPGRTGSVHDHADAWVLYGLLDGHETLERFDRVDDRSKEDYAEVRLASADQGQAGKADLVQPYDIHAEQGSEIRSVAVILRSRVLVGQVLQGRYDRDTNRYSTGSGPEQIPYELTA
jgi:hypothetical protein